MAEQVMEQIGLGDVIDLLGFAQPPGHRETAVGQVIEKRELGQQPFDADQLPAGPLASTSLRSAKRGIASGVMPKRC